MSSTLLQGEKLVDFCKELDIEQNKNTKILVKIIDNKKAEYYNSDTDKFEKIELEVAKKYI